VAPLADPASVGSSSSLPTALGAGADAAVGHPLLAGCFAVPFFPQPGTLDCGPNALRMALSFVDPSFNLSAERLCELCGLKAGRAITTVELCLAVARLGYPCYFSSTSISFDESHMQLQFYQNFGDRDAIARTCEIAREAAALGATVVEQSVSVDEVLRRLGPTTAVVALLDMNVVRGVESSDYSGHFAPVVGCDDEHVYIHNGGAFTRLTRSTFDAARRARGTDEDFLVIGRRV
jgi:hypothetical protein